jgi:hypothetical protein
MSSTRNMTQSMRRSMAASGVDALGGSLLGHRKGMSMAKPIYSVIASLDSYVADEDGKFDWAEPDEEVHSFVNDLERPVGTYLYGRRMYDVLAAWENLSLADQPRYLRDYAEIRRAADKIVYATTLETVSSARTRLERDFDPEAFRQLEESPSATSPLAARNSPARRSEPGWWTSEYHVFVARVVVGGGIDALPSNVRLELELADERHFGNGMLHLRYRAVPSRQP